MSSTDLYVIAAGNGSRMKVGIPKALIPIADDEPCLTTTLRQLGHNFRKVFIVTNVLASDQWRSYFVELQAMYPALSNRIVNVPIQSGLGDGHATLHGLLSAEKVSEDSLAADIVVAWGDVFFPHPEIINELLATKLKGSGLLPAIQENNPYVSLLVNEQMQGMWADFSKYGETNLTGMHDQSVFRFARSKLIASLSHLHACLWKSGRYMTPGSELSLLYVVHQLYNSGDPTYVYETGYPTLGFNCIEEAIAIQRNIKAAMSDDRRRRICRDRDSTAAKETQ
jgi:molybdopterin-guanine dinucleotide biosynthesis protein A